jgi:uncharacterized protein YndB with AHSA1/START domain
VPLTRLISTSIDIKAPASRIWRILTDFPAYSTWNPFVRSIAGSTSPGSRLKVTVQPQGGQPMSFAPEVLACVEEREFRWRVPWCLSSCMALCCRAQRQASRQ